MFRTWLINFRYFIAFALGISFGTSAKLFGIDLAAIFLILFFALIIEERYSRYEIIPSTFIIPSVIIPFLACFFFTNSLNGWDQPAAKHLLKYFIILIIGSWTTANINGHERHIIKKGLYAIFFANLAIAILQLLTPQKIAWLTAALYGKPYLAGGNGPTVSEEFCCGLFSSHSLFILFLIISIPFIIQLLGTKFKAKRYLITTFIITIFLCSQTIMYLSGLLIFLAVAITTAFILLPFSTPSYKNIALTGIAIITLSTPFKIFNKDAQSYFWQSGAIYTVNQNQHLVPKRLLLDYAAAFQNIKTKPFGDGSGKYSKSINKLRIENQLPYPYENRIRRDTASQLLLLTIEIGLLGALAWFLLIITTIWRGLDYHPQKTKNKHRLTAAICAVIGSLIAGLTFTPITIGGGGIFLGILLGFLWHHKEIDLRPLNTRLLAMQFTIITIAALAGTMLYKKVKPINKPIEIPKKIISFHLEAEQCISKSELFIIASADSAGDHSVLSIPRGVGKQNGEASYEIQVPETGKYKLWIRANWHSACSNSIICQIDDLPPLVLSDTIYKRWHWLTAAKQPLLKLSKGKHTLILKNSEDGVKIDQILFMNNPNEQPVGIAQKQQPDPIKKQENNDLFNPKNEIPNEDFDKYQ